MLTNRFGESRRQLVLAALQALLSRAEYIPVVHRVRPMSPDPDDDFVIECAYNAGATIVTENMRELEVARTALGLAVLSATAFVARLQE